MSDLIYLDASFFVPLQVEKHPYRKYAIDKLKSSPISMFCYSYLTLDEIMYVLGKYIKNKNLISTIINRDLLNNKLNQLVGLENDVKCADQFIKTWPTTGLKPRDALHLFTMKKNGIKKIATFDNDFIKNKRKLGIEIF